MRRFTRLSTTAAITLIAAIPIASAANADDATRDPVVDLEAIRLDCQVRTTDAAPVVRCEWSSPTSAAAAAIKLFRLDPAVDDHRMVVYRSENLRETVFVDSHVRPAHKYAYAVVVVDVNGRTVGRSRAEWVRVPGVVDPETEALRLHCALGGAGEAIGCEWSRPQSRDAYVVSLWRSVDGGPRELVERFRPSGPNTYRDAVPAGSNRITYAVIATSESDRIVARSRAVTVVIPDVPVTDIRPVDTRPVDRPADTRPAASERVAP